uniref:DNA repair and recombination protein RAD54B n=1 Tax=Entomoneis paludosa TaxID=265537 RepID=A0A7S2YCU9_9STRA|mmetsp:Transcript_27670/g.57926  ORF Transcript_27670/g.57926 Transcript_27670/m.57926 type:complete len:735 (+) Transcript_27670:160-2364(+)
MEYEVLYYKRTNKVHKSKGVSKADGILKVVPSQGTVVLRASDSASTEEESCSSSSDEEETTRKRKFAKASKKKKNKRQIQKPQSGSTIYSGRNAELSKRTLEEDDTFVIGNFEVQIISLRTNPFGASTSGQKPLARKQPLVSKQGNAIGAKPGQGTKLVKNPLQQRSLLPQKRKAITSLGSSTAKNPQQNRARAPPKQPKSDMKGISPRSAFQPPNRNPAPPRQPITSSSDAPKKTSHPSSGVLPHIPLTASIRSALRPHQVSGIDFLWRCLTGELRGALLADEMGLGKTLMTIATIAALHKLNRRPSFVVVAPSTLIGNWSREFDVWLGKAGQPKRVAIKKGGEDGQHAIQSFCAGMKQNLSNQVGQVLIVSYDLFRRNEKLFRDIRSGNIQLLVSDEAHRLKNTQGSLTLSALQSLPATSRLCLTATPIQNNLSEFFNVANFCCPSVFPDLAQFRKEFDRPIGAGNSKNATREQKQRAKAQSMVLDKKIKTFMLRRLQKDVLKDMLPPRTEVLLFCLPSPAQSALYQKTSRSASGADASEVLTALTALRKISCCGDERKSTQLPGKMKVLSRLLLSIRKNAPGEKVVVVSNYTSALSAVEESILKPAELTYVRLDGTTDVKNRQTLVDSFNLTSSDRSFCFLLSAKAGGCGLNLVGASRLIMMDPDWNPSTDIQAMARIYRQGQTRPTVIYRLFTSGTIEEVRSVDQNSPIHQIPEFSKQRLSSSRSFINGN